MEVLRSRFADRYLDIEPACRRGESWHDEIGNLRNARLAGEAVGNRSPSEANVRSIGSVAERRVRSVASVERPMQVKVSVNS